jgi:hypothetical protein
MVFAMTPQGQLSTLFDFGDGARGVWPNRLIETQDGNIIGATLGIAGRWLSWRCSRLELSFSSDIGWNVPPTMSS